MFWNVRAMPSQATLCGLKPVMLAPSNSTVPSLGGIRPVMPLKSVVLPAPLGPISANISPRLTSKLTSSTAVRPPNRLVTLRSLRMAPSLIRGPRKIADFVGWSCDALNLRDGPLMGALGQLFLADAAGNQPLRPQQHRDHQDQAEEHEVQPCHRSDSDVTAFPGSPTAVATALVQWGRSLRNL